MSTSKVSRRPCHLFASESGYTLEELTRLPSQDIGRCLFVRRAHLPAVERLLSTDRSCRVFIGLTPDQATSMGLMLD